MTYFYLLCFGLLIHFANVPPLGAAVAASPGSVQQTLAQGTQCHPADQDAPEKKQNPKQQDCEQKKPRLILHLGPGKTGTSALEKFLGENAALLEKRGVYFPLIDPACKYSYVGSGNLFRYLEPFIARARDAVFMEESYIRLLGQWQEQMQEKNCHVVLLTNERFLRDFGPDSVAAFHRLAKKHFDVVVIAYVREPYAWSFSAKLQSVKAGRLAFLEMRKAMEELKRLPWVVQAAKKIRPFVLCCYEKHMHEHIAHFFHLAGLDDIFAKGGWCMEKNRRINRSLTMSENNVLFLLKKSGLASLCWTFMCETTRENPDAKAVRFYDPVIAKQLYQNHAQDIAYVNQWLPKGDRLPTKPHCPQGYSTQWDHEAFAPQDISLMMRLVGQAYHQNGAKK